MKKSVQQNQLLNGFAEGINKDLITQAEEQQAIIANPLKKYKAILYSIEANTIINCSHNLIIATYSTVMFFLFSYLPLYFWYLFYFISHG